MKKFLIVIMLFVAAYSSSGATGPKITHARGERVVSPTMICTAWYMDTYMNGLLISSDYMYTECRPDGDMVQPTVGSPAGTDGGGATVSTYVPPTTVEDFMKTMPVTAIPFGITDNCSASLHLKVNNCDRDMLITTSQVYVTYLVAVAASAGTAAVPGALAGLVGIGYALLRHSICVDDAWVAYRICKLEAAAKAAEVPPGTKPPID